MIKVSTSVQIKWKIYRIRLYFLKMGKLVIENVLCLLLHYISKIRNINANQNFKSIIIPLMHGLGDAIIFSTCLRELLSIFPEAKITCITTVRTMNVLSNDFNSINFMRISSIFQLRRLRNQYDLIILPARKIN